MNETPNACIWQRSSCVRFVRWLFTGRRLRRVLIALGWSVTLIALLYTEENWRGQHVWDKYRQAREAQGERFDFAGFIPEPIPADQNFAATPFFENLFASKTNRYDWNDAFSRADAIVRGLTRADRLIAHHTVVDLVAWERALTALQQGRSTKELRHQSGKLDPDSRAKAAPIILEAMRGLDPVLKELRTASQRPRARYSIHYNLDEPLRILLPHLSTIQTLVQRLQLITCARLAGADSPAALADVKLMLRLVDSLEEEPFLISYLVRCACLRLATQPVWEGLAEHRWSDAQLQELQAGFEGQHFVSDLKRSFDIERASCVLTAELLLRHQYRLEDLCRATDASGQAAQFVPMLGGIAPRGWYHLEQLNYCRLAEGQLQGVVDWERRRITPRMAKATRDAADHARFGSPLESELHAVLHQRLLSKLMNFDRERPLLKAAGTQTIADQATIACALERYRLVHTHYPDRLDALVPEFLRQLPRDSLTGEPYRYRLGNDGSPVIYSIGWDLTDDGGKPGQRLFEEKQGDWVWDYADRRPAAERTP